MQKKALVIVNQHTARPKLRSDLLDILDTITKGGYDCLVRPTQSAGDERDVYLPVSENWVDYFTGEKVESGHIKVSTKGIPVYRKI